MERIEKTVFISYRRTNIAWALAIFQNLTQYGFDVFFDYSGIASGDFEQSILENINARVHFLVLLTPSALENCVDASDWLRREIEAAIDSRRNIIPLMLEAFDFGAPKISAQLTGKLAALKRYNGMTVPPEYFLAAMDKLRNQFLNVPLKAVSHPPSMPAKEAARLQQTAAVAAPSVPEKALTAQQWFERAYAATAPEDRLRLYTEAIRLKPDYVEAFNNRGVVRRQLGDLEGALADYNEALRLRPDFSRSYNNRGVLMRQKGEVEAALHEYGEALRYDPDNVDALVGRGITLTEKGDYEQAGKDLNRALELQPSRADAIHSRAFLHHKKGDFPAALRDYDETIRLTPNDILAHKNRSIARRATGDVAGADQDLAEATRLETKP